MAVVALGLGYHQFFDDDGKVLSGGTVQTFLSSTGVPVSIYQNASGALHETTISLDSAGATTIYLDSENVYRIRINDDLGNEVRTVDGISVSEPADQGEAVDTGTNAQFLSTTPTGEDPDTTTKSLIFTNHENTLDSNEFWHVKTDFFNFIGGAEATQISISQSLRVAFRVKTGGTWASWSAIDEQNADNITSGVFHIDRIPNIPYSKITEKPDSFPPDDHNHDELYRKLDTSITSADLTDGLTPSNAIQLGETDLNSITTPGFYYQTSNANTSGRNYPSGNAGSLIVQKSAGVVTQIYIDYNIGSTHTRTYYTSWSSWRTFSFSSHHHDSTYALLDHNHSASVITSGTISGSRLPMDAGGVGTYGFFYNTSSSYVRSPGNTLAGSSLRYANCLEAGYKNESPSGTWRCMGNTGYYNYGNSSGSGNNVRTTLWVRIA